jgi:hypothetical protein
MEALSPDNYVIEIKILHLGRMERNFKRLSIFSYTIPKGQDVLSYFEVSHCSAERKDGMLRQKLNPYTRKYTQIKSNYRNAYWIIAFFYFFTFLSYV